jgi:hypothetical protein
MITVEFLMRHIMAALLAISFVAIHAQPPSRDAENLGHGLPDLKSEQRERLLKEDKRKSLDDAAEILDRAQALKDELDLNDPHVLSMKVLKQTEEIEKLAKRIRGRMRRF